jgi:anti-anti-sigma regulatory factor
MNITCEKITGHSSIALISIQGDLDASNYQELISTAHQAYEDDARFLLIDMSATPFMSSSGLVALHTVTLIMQGQPLPDPDLGWGAVHAIDSPADSSAQRYVKLIHPLPQVERALEKTGLKSNFEIYNDRTTAFASFNS